MWIFVNLHCCIRVLILISIICVFDTSILWAAGGLSTLKWDKNLLLVEYSAVHINAKSMQGAWRVISTKYFIRANIYEVTAIDNQTPFIYNKDTATGEDLLDAFLAVYTDYTYTQNPETGIIWVYPKSINYGDLLNNTIVVARGVSQIPVYLRIFSPLCRLLAPSIVDPYDASNGLSSIGLGIQPAPFSWSFGVDIPAGTYSIRQIMDMICLSDPTKAFVIQPIPKPGLEGSRVAWLTDLIADNPFAPPRLQTVKFWGIEVGETTNGTPSYDEVRAAMSSSDPKTRTAASLYLESAKMNYSPLLLIGKANSSEQAIWTALGVEYADVDFRNADGAYTNFFAMLEQGIPRVREDLKQIKNPLLTLLTSLELIREGRDASYLNAAINKHQYSEEEIISIKPELTRMARSSKTVRDKLLEMKSSVPDLSPEALGELADTNSFLVLPQVGK